MRIKTTKEEEVVMEVMDLVVVEATGEKTTTIKRDNEVNKIGGVEDAIVEEAVIQIVLMLIVTIAASLGTMQEIVGSQRSWKRTQTS